MASVRDARVALLGYGATRAGTTGENRMRILVVADQWFPDYAGGTARVVQATARGLAKRGHEVVVIVPSFEAEPESSAVDGVEVRRVIRRGLMPQALTDVFETRRAIRAIWSRGFDVILAHNVVSAAGAQAAKVDCPVVLVFHASSFREARHRRSLGLPAMERWRSLGVEPVLYIQERLALRHAKRIVVLSEFSRELVLAFDADAAPNLEIAGGGVDVDLFAPSDARDSLRARLAVEPNQKLLVTARRLIGRMGLEMLLQAFRLLYSDDDTTRLVIIGEGELRATLEDQRDNLGLRDVTRFVGRVSDEDLRDWYCASDVFVLPTVAYEGFGMVTAEALACGTPVVGTPVGATGEILAPFDEGLLATGVTAESFALAINHALDRSNPETRAECRAYAEQRLSWEQVIVRWERAIARVV